MGRFLPPPRPRMLVILSILTIALHLLPAWGFVPDFCTRTAPAPFRFRFGRNEAVHIISLRQSSSSTQQQLRPRANEQTRAFNTELNRLSRSGVKGSARKADDMLFKTLERVKSGEETNIFPNVVSFATVLNAWSRSYEADAACRAEELLTKNEQMYKETRNDGMRPNKYTYVAVINALARSREPDAASRAEAILRKMEKLCESGDEGCCPDSYVYSSCINAWSRSNRDDSPERAHALLEKMEEPDTVAYTSVIQSYARSRRSDAAEKAEQLLDCMNDLVANGQGSHVAPNFRTVNVVLQAFEKKSKVDESYAQKAETLLRRMEEQYNAGYAEMRPTTTSYNLVLKAYANSGAPGAAERAGVLLNRMYVVFEATGSAYVKPDKRSFGSVIIAHAKGGGKGPDKALQILKAMVARYDAGDEGCRPTTYIYNVVLDGFANASSGKNKGYGRKAENLLLALEERFHQGEADLKPNLVSYNTVLKALSRSNEKWAAERSDDILSRMEELYESGDDKVRADAISYASVIRAYAKSRKRGNGSARRAEEVLQRQIGAFKSGHAAAKPNFFVFSTVANAMAKHFTPESAEKATKLLEEMKELREFVGGTDDDLSPDTTMYNCVLKTLARNQAPENAIKAEELVREMEQSTTARPDLTTYNTLINAWSHSRSNAKYICGQKAVSILEKLEAMYREGSVKYKPDRISFNCCIKTLARSLEDGAAAKAEDYLNQMKDEYEAGNVKLAPDCRTYSSCINAWANSGDALAGERAEKLLEEQWQLFRTTRNARVKPDFITYTAAMKAWVNSGNDSAAIDRVNRLLDDMLSRFEDGDASLRPSRPTYEIIQRAFGSDVEAVEATMEEVRRRVAAVRERVAAVREK